MSMSLISDHGTEEQKQAYLPGACRGDIRFCFAVTEADAGTNTINVTSLTRSVKDKGRYVLNGRKTFITDAECAEYMIVVTRSTPLKEAQRKTDGFTLVLIDTKVAGIEVHPIDISIEVPEDKYTVFFDDVDVGPENIIGEVDRGFEILFESLNPERIIISAVCCGLGRYALNRAVEYANERVVFNGPIGAYQALQHPLARGKTEIEMASLMMRKAA
ncbi:MAG TPA: acyl-CoA dehydrogenase, partial [Porticoccaceae bacterium]|nr:acyl-CoA dehydrogenase [Porticoccaceae bacterium]